MSDAEATTGPGTPLAPRCFGFRPSLARRLQEIVAQRPANPPPVTASAATGPTVADALDAYDVKCRREGCTSVGRASRLRQLGAYLGRHPLAALQTQHVEQFVADALAAGYKPASVQAALAYLHAALHYTQKRGELATIPYLPSLKFHNARQGFFAAEEFTRIVARLREPYAAIARFGYATGWRLSEILTLQWAQADRERREIRLPRTKNGEGRVVPLAGERLAIIEQQWRKRTYRTRLAEWVFHIHGQRITRDRFWRAWKAAREAAGLPHKFFHDLRRTFCRDFIEAGGDYATAMACTGHRTMQTFLRYQITDMRGMERGLEAMDKKRNGVGAARKRKG